MKRIVPAILIAVGVLGIGGVVTAKTLQYRAAPAGEFEVAPVETSAEGELKLKVSSDGTEVRYDLKVKESIDDVFMAHLHRVEAGTNGGIVVWLFPSAPTLPRPPIEGSFDGRLATGVITEGDLVGSLAGDWDGFLAELANGGLYVNVHTVGNPGGEIRDQVHVHP